jgi:hypothetical protein
MERLTVNARVITQLVDGLQDAGAILSQLHKKIPLKDEARENEKTLLLTMALLTQSQIVLHANLTELFEMLQRIEGNIGHVMSKMRS